MSIALMTKAWKVEGISATKKLVLLALCDWANDEGGSLHPSMTRIAQRAGCSERQAQRVVHELIADGFLTVIGNEFGGKPGQSRQYQLNVEKLETGDTGVTGVNLSRVTNKAETGDICDTGRVTFEAETGDAGVTLTTIDPSIEPSEIRHAPAGKPQRVRSAGQLKTMRAWLAEKAERGEDAVPESDPVFAYAEKIGLPEEFVRLAWREFRAKYIDGRKRYTDWPAAFRNCVRDSGWGLWRATSDGYVLASKGIQAQRAHEAQQLEAA